jgi:hypothetical protein
MGVAPAVLELAAAFCIPQFAGDESQMAKAVLQVPPLVPQPPPELVLVVCL